MLSSILIPIISVLGIIQSLTLTLEKSKAFKNFMGDILITLIEEKVNDESTEANTQESNE